MSDSSFFSGLLRVADSNSFLALGLLLILNGEVLLFIRSFPLQRRFLGVRIGDPRLSLSQIPLSGGVDYQPHSNQKRNGNGSDDESLPLGCRLSARQDVLRLQSGGLGILFGALAEPPLGLAQIFAIEKEALVLTLPFPLFGPC